jgi:hypothetical protein
MLRWVEELAEVSEGSMFLDAADDVLSEFAIVTNEADEERAQETATGTDESYGTDKLSGYSTGAEWDRCKASASIRLLGGSSIPRFSASNLFMSSNIPVIFGNILILM